VQGLPGGIGKTKQDQDGQTESNYGRCGMNKEKKYTLAYFAIVIVCPFVVAWIIILLVLSMLAGMAGVG
jgi:hypothetical protein